MCVGAQRVRKRSLDTLSYVVLDMNSCPLQEQYVLLTTEPSLWPLNVILFFFIAK